MNRKKNLPENKTERKEKEEENLDDDRQMYADFKTFVPLKA